MEKLRKTAMLLCLAGIPAAAAPFFHASPDLCFAAGSVTYRLSGGGPSPDYRVAIDNQAAHPDLRIALVDRVDVADFALTDDTGALTGDACESAGPIKTVRIVPAGAEADIIITVSADPARTDAVPNDFSLYVHSARVSHFDAAALFALVRRAPEADRAFNGERVAVIR